MEGGLVDEHLCFFRFVEGGVIEDDGIPKYSNDLGTPS